ncbi:MAG: peptide ABC transporter substrate-binding protein [Pseudobdellovibrionaceae bacterium]
MLRRKWNLVGLSLITIFTCAFLFSKTLQAAPATGAKDVLKIGMTAEFETLHPMIAEQGATKYMLYLAWRPMVVLSIENKWSALMIKKIPTIENGMVTKKGEGLDVNFEILPEYKWGDGKPVTCKDIEFAWRLGKHPNVSTPSKEGYTNVTAVTWDEKNPKKCMMSFSKSKFDYFANLIDPMPEHLEGPVFEKFKDTPQGYDHNTLYTKDPTNPGLYNGPFMISEVKLGSHVSFSANPNFGGKKPKFKQILFKLIPNGATLTTNLQSGDIDMISPPAGLSLDQALAFDKITKAEKLPYKVVFADGLIYSHIDINTEIPGLNDLAVRKAMALTTNQKQIVDSFFEGRGKPAYQFVTATDPWFSDKFPKHEYNRREANRVLDEAGWKMGANGIRSKDGKNLSFIIYGSAGNKIVENIEALLQSQFKSIGIELKIKNEPPRVFFGETTKKRKFDLAFFSWMSIPESSPRSILHSTMIPAEANSWSGQNYTGYKNPEVDKWIEELELEFNAKKRTAIGQKIINAYIRDIPVLPIYFRPNTTVIPADMTGYKLSGHLFYESLYAENWARK